MGKGIFINLIFYYFYFILLSLFMETCILQVFMFTPSSQGRVQVFPAGTRELVGRGGECFLQPRHPGSRGLCRKRDRSVPTSLGRTELQLYLVVASLLFFSSGCSAFWGWGW